MRPSKNNVSQEIAGRVINEVFAALRDAGVELDLQAMTTILARVNAAIAQEPSSGERRSSKPVVATLSTDSSS